MTPEEATGVLGPLRRLRPLLAMCGVLGLVALAAFVPRSTSAFTAATASAGNSLTAAEWDALIALTGGHDKHTCTAKLAGDVFCWGENNQRQIGDGTTTNRTSPVQVLGPGGVGFLSAVTDVTAGQEHGCALRSDTTVWCWGRNDKGQLGDGSGTDRSTPVQVRGVGGVGVLSGVVVIEAGHKHSCAVMADGTMRCWGLNNEGQLGDGTTNDRTSPVVVLGPGGVGSLTNVVGGDGGETHTCAIRQGGGLWCWGKNDKGQVGDGTTTNRLTPVQVVGPGGIGTLANVTDVVAGLLHTCARTSGAVVYCFGNGASGQNGDGSTSDRVNPVLVSGVGGVGTLTGVERLAHGDSHLCAVRSDTSVVCWGRNNQGQLGDGTTTDRSAPVAVRGAGGVGTLSGAVLPGAGGEHSCVSRTNRTVWCWGRNDRGQMGDGTFTDRPFPVQSLLP